jgi:hypothetical protein
MDLTKVLTHLHAELNNLNAAIASVQRLQQGDLQGRERQLSLQMPGGKAGHRTRKAKPHSVQGKAQGA